MMARKGPGTPHFAHKPGASRCAPETALHRIAIQLIVDAFAEAKATARPYLLTWTCPGCDQDRQTDVARDFVLAAAESQLVPNTRADVSFLGPRPFVIEIEVTHAPAAQTLSRYEAAGVPIFVVKPTWLSLDDLRFGARAVLSYFVRTTECNGCLEKRKEQERERLRAERALKLQEQQQRAAAAFRARVENALAMVVAGDPKLVRRWQTGANGRALDESAQRWADYTAPRLAKLGFRQTRDLPWLFSLDVPGIAVVYVYLGGRRRITDGGSSYFPTLTWKPRFAPHLEAALAEAVIKFAAKRRVNVGVRWGF